MYCTRLTCTVFGTVHSDSTVVVLLHEHFSCSFTTFCNSVSITTLRYATLLWPMSSIRSTIQLITSNFPSIPIVFRPLFTRIALGDVDLRFSLISVTHASAAELHQPRDYTTNVIKPQTGPMGVTSFSASLPHKTSAATDRVCRSL